MEKKFKYALGAQLVISVSGEKGEVVARLDSAHSDDEYRLWYKAADGRAVHEWMTESALEVPEA